MVYLVRFRELGRDHRLPAWRSYLGKILECYECLSVRTVGGTRGTVKVVNAQGAAGHRAALCRQSVDCCRSLRSVFGWLYCTIYIYDVYIRYTPSCKPVWSAYMMEAV